MGIGPYECTRCRGRRCARFEATDPAYPQSPIDPDSQRCTVECRGGQSCWEKTTVLVPQRLLAVAGRLGRGKGVVTLTLPRVIPASYDGYHHYADVAPGGSSLRQTLTSGGLVMPASEVSFTTELWHLKKPEDCAELLQRRGLKYLVLAKAWCRSCWEKEEREHPGVAAAAAGGGDSADAEGSGEESEEEEEEDDDDDSDNNNNMLAPICAVCVH